MGFCLAGSWNGGVLEWQEGDRWSFDWRDFTSWDYAWREDDCGILVGRILFGGILEVAGG